MRRVAWLLGAVALTAAESLAAERFAFNAGAGEPVPLAKALFSPREGPPPFVLPARPAAGETANFAPGEPAWRFARAARDRQAKGFSFNAGAGEPFPLAKALFSPREGPPPFVLPARPAAGGTSNFAPVDHVRYFLPTLQNN